MPVTLPNLYTRPNDVYEMCGADAIQLRLDDQNNASGQQVSTTSDSPIGSTTIAVNSLQYGLLQGARLVFSDAGMSTPVEVTVSAVAMVGSTSISVVTTTVDIPSGAIAIDNGVNVWLAGLLVKACSYGTARIKLYCCGRYDDSALVNSWSVNQWATVVAARWLAVRLFRAAPEGIENQYKECLEELKEVQAGNLNIEDIGTRTSGWPFLSNISISDDYTWRRLRVDPQTSEPTPCQYSQEINWSSALAFEW